ncbi:SDR family oxidoreductase [Saccharopolyspora griseoalba]|uniref:SDR family oxidoreductase n=1 Tax=Saccharopolyspora griseoalba TaxID=1431848 RepID=A0ABW2LHM9_9PSEU
MIDPRLRGRVAVVTGADSALGVGAAVARGLARHDVRLLLVRSPAAGDHVAASLRADGATVQSVAVDLADPGAAEQVFEVAEQQVGAVQILVNNAAHHDPDTFAGSPGRGSVALAAEGLDAHYAVNTRAPALLIAEFHRRHLARRDDWGRVITIAAEPGCGGAPAVSLRATTGALESLTRSAAAELGPAGITANLVASGVVQTGWLRREAEQRLAEQSPLGRAGGPEDVADVVVFLASHQARWLTGQMLRATGGSGLR